MATLKDRRTWFPSKKTLRLLKKIAELGFLRQKMLTATQKGSQNFYFPRRKTLTATQKISQELVSLEKTRYGYSKKILEVG